MKRLLLILLIAFPCLSRAQGIAAQISSVDSLIYALIQTPTTPGSVTHGHEAYILYEIDSTLRALYNSIGASGNLQAVTALGNNTNTGIYVGATGSYTVPNTGTRIISTTEVQEYVGGVYQGGLASNVYQSVDLSSGNIGVIKAGRLTGVRTGLVPDEGTGVGLASTIVLHKTKDQITVGDTSTQGTKQTIYGDWCYKSGIPFSYMGDDGAGAWEAIFTSSTHGGTTTLHDDTTTGTLNQWLSLGSGTYAMLDDTAKGRNGLYLMTEHTYDSLVALAGFITPTSKSTLTNKRITTRDTAATSYTTNVTFNSDNYTGALISAQAGALNFVNFTGTPQPWDGFKIGIVDNGTPVALTWGTAFKGTSSASLPTTTVSGKVLLIQLVDVFNTWWCTGVVQQ